MCKKINAEFIEELIILFMQSRKRRAVYNEFSLQHELGIFLRKKIEKIDPEYKVEFERNVSYFDLEKDQFIKNEIDIVIYCSNKNKDRFAIELKYHPIGCNVPQRMINSIVDIAFMGKMTNEGFVTFVLAVTEDDRFYTCKGRDVASVYKYFRDYVNIDETAIREYEGKVSKDDKGLIKGTYKIEWKDFEPSIEKKEKIISRKYYVLKIK